MFTTQDLEGTGAGSGLANSCDNDGDGSDTRRNKSTMLMMSTPDMDAIDDMATGAAASEYAPTSSQTLPPVNVPSENSMTKGNRPPGWAAIKSRSVYDNDRLVFGVSPRQTRYVKREKNNLSPNEVISHDFVASMSQM